MSLVVITPPTTEPVSLSEAKAHLRVDFSQDDTEISFFIVAAREQAEAMTRRTLAVTGYELVLPAFPAVIELPRPPLVEVQSIAYLDADGDEQTLSADGYRVDSSSLLPRVYPVDDWPETEERSDAVRVRYSAGFTPTTIPASVKAWILLIVGSLYENRESISGASLHELPFADRLLDRWTILEVA